MITSSCGPMYRQVHNYYPPEEREGKFCISTCSASKSQCINNCENREQTCIMNARTIDALMCSKNAENCDDYRYSSHYECNSHSCKADCEVQYNQCYTNCGGTVETRTVCVANCEQAE